MQRFGSTLSKSIVFLSLFTGYFHSLWAQYNPPLYTRYTTTEARTGMMERLTANTIEKGLQRNLHDEGAEEYFMHAFTAMEVFRYHSATAVLAIEQAFDSALERSEPFQRALLELVFTNYPVQFTRQVWFLADSTPHARTFAMCSEYLLQEASNPPAIRQQLLHMLETKFGEDVVFDPILFVLKQRLEDTTSSPEKQFLLPAFFSPRFFPGRTILYSLQRKNRDYPGLAIIRKGDGSFVTTGEADTVFWVPQLARSITNLPFYLRNGNTPQGIFKMNGFGVSTSQFIGPTTNVQMGMPLEFSKKKFFDAQKGSSPWTLNDYKALLPTHLQNYLPLYEAYYAGLIGRNEIIAHGTTLDPAIYTGAPYFPLTPTMGCLTTMEWWNGSREQSDQQNLVNALAKAGGAKGYVVVLEIDDREAPVEIHEILPYLLTNLQ